MTIKRIGIKLLKITGIFLGVIVILFTVFHFWFINHAKSILKDAVDKKSNGKIKLTIEKLSYNYFNHRMKIKEAVFQNIDTTTAPTAYKFSIKEIRMELKALLPLVLEKKLLIDSLYLQSPDIQVSTLRYTKDTIKTKKEDISIPYEMGKVYKSIQDALKILHVNRFQIDNATFRLINRIQPEELALNISNIHFHIDNLSIDTAKLSGNEKILFSDNVVLQSRNQNILFPDGRHRLAFSRFKINLQKKVVEFDSCTIEATKKDSSTSSFKVFFDALLLTNIDFDTLYKSDVIKADSVYCINPKFNLEVELGKKKNSKKQSQKLENIIRELTGDLQLHYVVVANADFNIKTVKDGKPSTFTFSKNNFEIQGLSIDQNRSRPIKIQNFVMAIRNYENFIRDSSYSVKFDSVLFKDDQIILSSFVLNKLENGQATNTFSMPQFRLEGMSWDELVFEKRLKAEQAIMFNPFINYTTSTSTKKKADKQNIFQSLSTVNDYMDLQYLDIINGTIDLKLKNNLRVQLENADVAIQSNSLLTSTKLSGIKNSLTNLSFKNGKILAGNLTMELKDIRYVGKSGQFGAGSISINDKQKKIAIDLQEIAVEKVQVNEISGSVFADGVKWQKGNVVIDSGTGKKEGPDAATIELKNVRGTNTTINATVAGKSISTNLASVFFNELIKKPDSKLLLDGLDIIGKQLQVKDNNLNLSVAEYDITDNISSSFRQILYKSNNGKMTADIAIPSLSLIPHVQPLLNGDIALDAINMVKPIIILHLSAKNTNNENKKAGLPKIDISELKLTQPTINFTQASDSGLLSLSWHGQKNSANFLQGSNLHTNAGITSVSNLNFYLTDFIFTNPKGKTFTTGDGKVAAQLKNIGLEQKENEPLEWKAVVADFVTKDFRLDSIGKTKGNLVLNSGSLHNLNVSSATITNLKELAAANTAFRLKQFTGNYVDATKNLQWYNAGFNRNSNIFSLDSFSFRPALERDSFIAKQSFQTDYISFKSDAVSIGLVDIDTYIRDNTLSIGTATINNLFFIDYKDKQKPFNAGIIKPLPVNMIKKIPQHLTVDTVLLTNANVEYTEVNEKIKKPGTFTVNRMTVRLINFKNYNIKPTDSLSLQANGYLMDTAWIRLRVKESYTDSLGGFLMTVRIKPADLTILNPALIPLASLKIESGFLDTLSMRAVGREYLSLGEMRMYYHDLKIRLLKNGDTTNARNFLSRVINTVVKNKNTSRMGQVSFIRKSDKSAINYLIKIALSGMSSSVGAKSNKKMIRKYKKELEKRNLPPIDFE